MFCMFQLRLSYVSILFHYCQYMSIDLLYSFYFIIYLGIVIAGGLGISAMTGNLVGFLKKKKDVEKETREDLEKAETNLHNVKKKKDEAVAEERGERRRLEILQTNLEVHY